MRIWGTTANGQHGLTHELAGLAPEELVMKRISSALHGERQREGGQAAVRMTGERLRQFGNSEICPRLTRP